MSDETMGDVATAEVDHVLLALSTWVEALGYDPEFEALVDSVITLFHYITDASGDVPPEVQSATVLAVREAVANLREHS